MTCLKKKASNGRGYGYIPDTADFRDHYLKFAVTRTPPSVDLTPSMPPVYDQGQLGSCTANAIAGAVEYERSKQDLTELQPSRLFIYYGERVIEGTVDEDSGAMIRDGIKVVANSGAPDEKDWPYEIAKFAEKPPQAAYDDALKDVVAKYARVYQRLTSMRACLAKGFPFVIGFTVYDSFESDAVAKTGKVPMPKKSERALGGHAVLCVGYDDKRKVFINRNSWGPDWGNKGYFTVPYDYWLNNDLASDIWNVQLVNAT